MKLIIIRHGDPDYEHDSLTQKGVREAQLLSDRISQLDVKAFYCSPLGRAQDTASYTLNKMNRTAETLPWLCEFEGKIVSGLKVVSCWDRLPSVWTKYPEHYDYDNWYKSKIMRYGTVERKYKNVCEGIDELLKKHGYEHNGRERGIASFRCQQFGDISHLYKGGEEPAFAARFCECFDDDTRH